MFSAYFLGFIPCLADFYFLFSSRLENCFPDANPAWINFFFSFLFIFPFVFTSEGG
jgi:hypothetical protein